jgi:nucleoid-associated protein YgaU
VLLSLGSGGCSSSQEGDSEDLENSDQQGQQDPAEENAESQDGQKGNQGENFSGNNLENTGDEQANAAPGDQQAAPQGNDLQEIISEMDQSAAQGGAKNEQAQAAPVNAVPAEAAAPAPAAAPAADTSTTSAGGLVGGLAGNPAGPGLPELGSKIPYMVRAGDTLAKISGKIYGSNQRWKEIATLTGLDNPNSIYPGDVVYFQLTPEAVAFAQTYLNATRQETVVQSGDTLETISKRAFGSPRYWKSIWRENDHITNPDQLVVGQTVFYISAGTASAAVETNEEDILNPNLNSSDDELAVKLVPSQLQDAQTSNDFDFETVNLSVTGEMRTINFGHGTTQNNVSLNS